MSNNRSRSLHVQYPSLFFLFCKHIHSSYIAVNVGRTCFAEIKMLRRGVHLQEPVQSTHLQEGEQTFSCAEITPINAYRYAKTGRKDDRLYCSVIISHHTRRALGFSSPVSRDSSVDAAGNQKWIQVPLPTQGQEYQSGEGKSHTGLRECN